MFFLKNYFIMGKLLFRFCLAVGMGYLTNSQAVAQPVNDTLDRLIDEKSQVEITQEADEIIQDISRLSGIAIKEPVKKEFRNKAFFESYYQQKLNNLYPPPKKISFEKAFALLGFLPENSDLIQSYLDSFMKVVRGLYDTKTKTLYIADWVNSEDQEMTLAHELVHALRDQNFDLQAYIDAGSDLSLDEQFARASVMEGEAVALSLDYSLEDKNTNFTNLSNIADCVRINNFIEEKGEKAFGRQSEFHEFIDFPYVYGASFLQKYIKAKGWKGMSDLFQNPPSCTQEVMHPEQYIFQRHHPIRIHIDDLSEGVLPGYNKLWENTLGEYGLSLLIKIYLGEEEARHSTLGWGGDIVQVYESNDGSSDLLLGYIVFRKNDQAEDFYKSYSSLLDQKYKLGGFKRTDETIHWAYILGLDREVYVEKYGRRIVFIEGTSSEQTARVRTALWDFQSQKTFKANNIEQKQTINSP